MSPTVLSRYRHVSHESNVLPPGKAPPFPNAFYTADLCENLAWIREDPAARPILYAIHISKDTRGI